LDKCIHLLFTVATISPYKHIKRLCNNILL